MKIHILVKKKKKLYFEGVASIIDIIKISSHLNCRLFECFCPGEIHNGCNAVLSHLIILDTTVQ